MKLLLPLLLFAQVSQAALYEKEIRSGLEYLKSHQSRGQDGYDIGQWRTQVTTAVPNVIGVGRNGEAYEEPTAFGTYAIANILAETYFLNPTFIEIPAMLLRSSQSLDEYRVGSLFNFYPPKKYHGLDVRGPRFMYLHPRWWGFTHIPPDADTTSVTYTFLHYQEALQRGLAPWDFQSELPAPTISKFSITRDVRRAPHAYNAIQGHIKTGAFMTWLFDEKDPAMPHYYFARPDKGPRIPFNVNDVDCVVNANVLKMLNYSGNTEGPGFRATCNYLNMVARRKQHYLCGMYYPSNWALPYTMASGIESGVSCLEDSRSELLRYILKKQQKNGAWQSQLMLRRDYVQSTVWALNALMAIGDPGNREHRRAVRDGLNYLLRHVRYDKNGNLYWKGEVFYAAIFAARFQVVWRSTAYTTALGLKALAQADRWF
jgi:hypothetical protein